jgi:hypothetical protein
MGLVISKGLTLRKGWQPMDPDAAAYITAVETADGQALEEKTKIAIDNFVLGCKADGIWTAIKASCILAGARTLTGALVPLAGTAPTSFNFVSGDYNRKTGLVGNGSSKYLDSNRAGDADPQNSFSLTVYASSLATISPAAYIGIGGVDAGASTLQANAAGAFTGFRSRNSAQASTGVSTAAGFIGSSRSDPSSFVFRDKGTNYLSFTASQTPSAGNFLVFARAVGTSEAFSNARLAFYSIGESLDLALLDARVTDLINAFGAAIA